MFIRFENADVEHMTEVWKYSIVRKGTHTTIVVWPKNPMETDEEYDMAPATHDAWQRMYVMNDSGKTIDTIRAPE